MQLVFCISAVLLVCAFASDFTFFVDDALDGPVSAVGCVQGNPCNMRSAWAACRTYRMYFSSCTIRLQDHTSYAVNPFYGALQLQPDDYITLQGGQDTVLVGAGSQLVSYYYLGFANVPVGVFPSLVMTDLTLIGFGNSNAMGGALMFYGDGQLTVRNVIFSQNYAGSGGAVFVSGSTLGASITNCTFNANYAFQYGGALTIDANNYNVAIVDSTFTDNQSGYIAGVISIGFDNVKINLIRLTIVGGNAAAGGAMLLAQGNRYVTIAETRIASCSASVGGGAMYILAGNTDIAIADSVFTDCDAPFGGAVYAEQNNERISFTRTQFNNCNALSGNGGAVNFNSDNSFIGFTNSTFTGCTTMGDGGAIYFNVLHDHISVTGSNFIGCSAKNVGGGIAFVSGNTEVLIADSSFARCDASRAGGVYVHQNNERISFTRTQFSNCNALSGNGGAVNFNSDNSFIGFTNSTFTGCTTMGDGGAIYFNVLHDHISVTGSNFIGCSAKNVGGGIAFVSGNTEVLIADSSFARCDASRAGGVYVHQNNQRISFTRTQFDTCSALSGSGGAANFDSGNTFIGFANSTFADCTATVDGGAIFFNVANSQISVTGGNFIGCSAENVGGGISFVSGNTEVLIADSSFARCDASGAGGVYVHQNNQRISFMRTQFNTCRARGNSGGALGILSGNSFIDFTSSTFENCTSTVDAGAIMVDGTNSHISVMGSNFTECSAKSFGGAVLFATDNTEITVADSSFARCDASAGGAVVVFMRNVGVSILRTKFDQCSSRVDHGGALHIYMYNSRVACTSCTFTNCTAKGNGGGVYLNGYNTEVSVVGTSFVGCSATGARSCGGAMHAEIQNTGVLLRNVRALSCTAPFGGGLYLVQGNTDATIDNCWFDHCTSAFRGGAINLDQANDNLLLVDTVISNCQSQFGGGIFSSRNRNIRIIGSEIRSCMADQRGGGLFLYAANKQVTLVETTFEANVAMMGGGGIASYALTRGLTVGGCTFVNNQARSADGGAVLLTGGNEQLVITDSNTATRLQVVESEHPYENTAPDGVILRYTVSDPDVLAFYLYFDADSALGSQDIVGLYDEHGVQVFAVAFDGSWPGRELPPFLLPGSSFTVLMTGGSSFKPPTSKADDLFGFRLYAVPMVKNIGRDTLFQYNRANGRGGALHAAFALNYAVFKFVRFTQNSAEESGGALSLRSASTGVYIDNVLFEENDSQRDGGALYIESSAGGLALNHCSFMFNSASNGGAVAFTVSNGRPGLVLQEVQYMSFQYCRMEGNHADLRGGAMYLDSDNQVVMSVADVNYNDAATGGAFYAGTANSLTFTEVRVVSNWVTANGGGMALGADNDLTLTNTRFTNNTAGKDICSVEMYAARVLSNISVFIVAAFHGGAICLEDKLAALILTGETTLDQNHAAVAGGALASFNSDVWTASPGSLARITRNTAKRGSALYYRGVPSNSTTPLEKLIVANNTATVGGTVFWLHELDGMASEPAKLLSGDVVWENNVAPYGEKVATQALSINSSDTYEVTGYAKELLPALPFSLRDYYGQVIPRDGDTRFTSSLARAVPEHCNGRAASLSGVLTESYHHNASFSGLQAVCAPDGNMTLTFEALLDLVEAPNTVVSTTVTLSFRSCQRGEFIKDGRCEVCPRGSYSLEYPVTDDTSCKDCTQKNGVMDCYSDVIEVSGGYWRRHDTSEAVLDCLGDANGCKGGVSTADDLCDEGYTGALCAVCSDGYYSSNGECTTCGGTPLISPTVVVFLIIAGMIVTALAFFVYAKCIDDVGVDPRERELADLLIDAQSDHSLTSSHNGNSLAGSATAANPATSVVAPNAVLQTSAHGSLTEVDDDSTAVVGFATLAKQWLRKRFHEIRAKLKIVITTYQIVSSIPSNLQVNFPGSFSALLKAFAVFNLNITAVIPFQCQQDFTFIDKLVFTTLFPIALAAALLVVGTCDVLYQTYRYAVTDPERSRTVDAVKDQYLTYFFFLTYLVLPSVSTTIFQTFLCTNVDPRGEDSDASDSYLIADMSISCTSSYYYKGVVYAVAMLLVYVVGIPLMYFLLLYYNREEIAHRDDKVTTAEVATQTNDDLANEVPWQLRASFRAAPQQRVMSSRAHRLAFLWDAYEPQYWYWEVVETTRRLMLTAVLSVCGAGTAAQSLLAVLLGVVYIKVYGYYAPYEQTDDDIIAEVGQFQIYFSFLGALIRQKELLGHQWNEAVSATLIVVNTAVTVLVLYFGYRNVRDELAAHRAEQQREDVNQDKGFKGRGLSATVKGLSRSISSDSLVSASTTRSLEMYSPAKPRDIELTQLSRSGSGAPPAAEHIGQLTVAAQVVDYEPDEMLLPRPVGVIALSGERISE
jgi:hypothetical protein